MTTFDRWPRDVATWKIDDKLIATSDQIKEDSGISDLTEWDEALATLGEPQPPMDLSSSGYRKRLYTKLEEYWTDDKSSRADGDYFPIDQENSIIFMCEYIFSSDIGERDYDSSTGYAWTKILNPIKDSSSGNTQYDDGSSGGDFGLSDARAGLSGAFSAYEDAVARRNNMIIGLSVGGGVCFCACVAGIVMCCMKMNKKDETPIVAQPANGGQNQSATEMVPGQSKM